MKYSCRFQPCDGTVVGILVAWKKDGKEIPFRHPEPICLDHGFMVRQVNEPNGVVPVFEPLPTTKEFIARLREDLER